jgi:hypothetical protein
MAILYRHIRLDKNEPFYIGIGTDVKRAYNKSLRNNWWKKIINKTNYEVQILFEDLTWEEACEKEKEFIALYGRRDLGTGTLCNMTDGGEGTYGRIFTHSDETKMKISKQKKGNNYWVGKKHSQESKDKISQSKKGHSVNKGKSHPAWNKGKSKINMEKVMEMIDSGITQTKIAEFFNTDQGTISRYVKKYRNIK